MKMFKHGLSRSRLYRIWVHMRGRCNNPQDDAYKNYGARGISVCGEWEGFVAFAEWAQANGYQEHLELDRINNNQGYCPENCRWVSHIQNNRNKRTNRMVSLNGKTACLTEMAERCAINTKAASARIDRRIKNGMGFDGVFSGEFKRYVVLDLSGFRNVKLLSVSRGTMQRCFNKLPIKILTAAKVAEDLGVALIDIARPYAK